MNNCKNSINCFSIGFWDNVEIELDYLGMTNKALAEKVGIAASNIGKGIKMGSSPSAETAVKIANVLNVSVEYLVTGKNENKSPNEINLQQYHKYAKTLNELDKIPENLRIPILEMISKVSKN